jgi:hypothetical protein
MKSTVFLRSAACAIVLSSASYGCTFLTSVSDSVSSAMGSISTSLNSMSGSISGISSSSSGGASAASLQYKNDVGLLTVLHLRGRSSADGFKRDLSDVAARHGVADWESNAFTFLGVGQGLKRAGVSQSEFNEFLARVAAPDAAGLVKRGYDS